MTQNKYSKAFTLLEILLVVAAIAILATIIILAINPNKQLGDTRNAKRNVDKNSIYNAIVQYQIDHGTLPDTIPTGTEGDAEEICKTGQTGSCIDLSVLTDDNLYLSSIPIDPSVATSAVGSGYSIYLDSSNNRVVVLSPNTEGTGGGAVAFACGDNVSYGGESYPTVLIGTQCWFAKNLNVGTMIVSTPQSDNSVLEKYCYDGDANNCLIYGGFYQWAEMVQYLNGVSASTAGPYSFSGNVQGICPTSWHLPSDIEWLALETYLGGPSVTGGKVKEIGTTHWITPNTGATNSSGFTAIPSGWVPPYGGGSAIGQGEYAYFYYGTALDNDSRTSFAFFDSNSITKSGDAWAVAAGAAPSVRCLKN